MGGIAQGAGSAVGGAVSGLAQAAGAAVPEQADDGVLEYLNSRLMRPALQGAGAADGTTSPGAPAADTGDLAAQTGIVLGNTLRSGEISDQDRAFLIAAVAQQTGQSQAEVEQKVDEAVKAVIDARAQAEQMAAKAKAEAERLAKEAEEAAIAAAETARKGAIMSAFLLTAVALVAGAAAMAGAVRGGRHRDEGRIWGGLSYRL